MAITYPGINEHRCGQRSLCKSLSTICRSFSKGTQGFSTSVVALQEGSSDFFGQLDHDKYNYNDVLHIPMIITTVHWSSRDFCPCKNFDSHHLPPVFSEFFSHENVAARKLLARMAGAGRTNKLAKYS